MSFIVKADVFRPERHLDMLLAVSKGEVEEGRAVPAACKRVLALGLVPIARELVEAMRGGAIVAVCRSAEASVVRVYHSKGVSI